MSKEFENNNNKEFENVDKKFENLESAKFAKADDSEFENANNIEYKNINNNEFKNAKNIEFENAKNIEFENIKGAKFAKVDYSEFEVKNIEYARKMPNYCNIEPKAVEVQVLGQADEIGFANYQAVNSANSNENCNINSNGNSNENSANCNINSNGNKQNFNKNSNGNKQNFDENSSENSNENIEKSGENEKTNANCECKNFIIEKIKHYSFSDNEKVNYQNNYKRNGNEEFKKGKRSNRDNASDFNFSKGENEAQNNANFSANPQMAQNNQQYYQQYNQYENSFSPFETENFNAKYGNNQPKNANTPQYDQLGKKRKKNGKTSKFRYSLILICVVLLCLSITILITDNLTNGNVLSSLKEAIAQNERQTFYCVEYSNYADFETAKAKSQELRLQGGAGYVVKAEVFRVIADCFVSKDDAENVVKKLNNAVNIASVYQIEIPKLNKSKLPKKHEEIASTTLKYIDRCYAELHDLTLSLAKGTIDKSVATSRILTLAGAIKTMQGEYESKIGDVNSNEKLRLIKLELVAVIASLENISNTTLKR
ncbi:MAG: hypothetical protein RRY78_05680, partial [Clostridia bacterium]